MINYHSLILTLVVLTSVLWGNGKAAETNVKLLVPMYKFASNDSDLIEHSLKEASDKVTVVLIVNPNNGPGSSLNSSWIDALSFIKKAFLNSSRNTGSYMIGYVNTNNGTRDIDEAKRDVDTYASWPDEYRPSGIFFDKASTTLDKLEYYQQLYEYVKQHFTRVFTNHGTNFPGEFLCSQPIDSETGECADKRATDTGVTFEGSLQDWKNFTVSNTNLVPRKSQLAVFITSMPSSGKTGIEDKVDYTIRDVFVNANAEFVYVTDEPSIPSVDILRAIFKIQFLAIPLIGYVDNS